MSHDPDNSHGAAADDEARSRPDEHSTSSTAEPDSDGTDECRRNPEERCEDDSEVGQLEHDLDTAEAALEGEIVIDPPSPRRVRQSKWKAPLPPPEALAAYNAIDPSFAERIVRSYERQIEIAERREDSINTAVDAQVRIQGMLASADVSLTKRGQWMLYSIAVFSLVAAVVVRGPGKSHRSSCVGHPRSAIAICQPGDDRQRGQATDQTLKRAGGRRRFG